MIRYPVRMVRSAVEHTETTPTHDSKGRLGRYQYIYDAWNRLVKIRSSEDTDKVFQTAEFNAKGRRIKKVVTNSGQYDKTEVYLYDGQKIIETRDGSNNMVQQFIHGTQYIDELVMIRVKDKGELYIHQDANWNVIATTNMAAFVVERTILSPYGELMIEQMTGHGDADGDGDVDNLGDFWIPLFPVTCTDRACVVRDLDFDGDYDSTDKSLSNSLPKGVMRYTALTTTATDQPFAHQGLLFEPEVGQYQNRLRQYDATNRRFLQWDPLLEGPDGLISHRFAHGGQAVALEFRLRSDGLISRSPSEQSIARTQFAVPDRLNSYNYESNAPITIVDPSGGCGSVPKPTYLPPPLPARILRPDYYAPYQPGLQFWTNAGDLIERRSIHRAEPGRDTEPLLESPARVELVYASYPSPRHSVNIRCPETSGTLVEIVNT